jgi:hypothetical protein
MIPDFVIKPRSVNFHFDAFADLNLEHRRLHLFRLAPLHAGATTSALFNRIVERYLSNNSVLFVLRMNNKTFQSDPGGKKKKGNPGALLLSSSGSSAQEIVALT